MGFLGLLIGLVLSAHAEQAMELRFASDVPPVQKALMQRDLEVLERYHASEDLALARLLERESATSAELQAWLKERIHVVVAESLQVDPSLRVVSSGVTYENPGLYPDEELSELPGRRQDFFGRKYVVVMGHLSSDIYVRGKKQGDLLGLEVPGLGVLPVDSPRSGIIQVGEGLFSRLPGLRGNLEAESYSWLRLSTYFHEARHSDGNGESLTFAHAVCPKGHAYAGRYACDRSLNGSYTVGAQVLSSFIRGCASCDAGEKEALKLRVLDSLNRVLKVRLVKDEQGRPLPVTAWDARPEGIVR